MSPRRDNGLAHFLVFVIGVLVFYGFLWFFESRSRRIYTALAAFILAVLVYDLPRWFKRK